jgi:hypothetical protein
MLMRRADWRRAGLTRCADVRLESIDSNGDLDRRNNGSSYTQKLNKPGWLANILLRPSLGTLSMWQTREEILELLAKSQRNIQRAQEIYRQFQELLRSVERFLSERTPEDRKVRT